MDCYSENRKPLKQCPLIGLSLTLFLSLAAGFCVAESSYSSSDAASWYALPQPDQGDWSNTRKKAYAKMQALPAQEPLAVLKVPSLDVAVAIYGDTEHSSLDRGAGWIEGTAPLGEAGNVGIAGHRDSFFRPLEAIQPGSVIQLKLPEQTYEYSVVEVRIVDALDTSVLEPSDRSIITLVTCYPFRYQGYAPDRFIVKAKLQRT